jgi:hypothetical protein
LPAKPLRRMMSLKTVFRHAIFIATANPLPLPIFHSFAEFLPCAPKASVKAETSKIAEAWAEGVAQ